MAVTYRRTNTASDLTGGVDFNKAILPPASDTTGTQTVSLGNGETRTSYAFTDVGVPGSGGVTGDFTVEMDVPTGNTSVEMSVTLNRVNSSGTVQQSSATSAEQTATAGVKTFSFTGVDLGTWVSGDRLRVDFTYRNSAHGGQDFDVNHGGVNNEVVVPWDAPTFTATASQSLPSLSQDASGSASAPASSDLPVTSGLVLDLDADAITGLSDGDPVVTWADQSGQGNDATGTGPTYQTNAMNGLPVVRFDAVDDFLQTSSMTQSAQPNTVFVVAKYDDVDTSNHNVINGVDSISRHCILTLNGTWQTYAGALLDSGVTDDADPHVFTALFNGASSVLRIDGTGTTGDPGSEPMQDFTIGGGAQGTNNPWDGDIAQVVAYDRELTTQERDDVEAYLTAKWLDAAATYTGTASQTLPALSQSAAGTHVPPTYTGTAAQTLPALSQDATGTASAPGTFTGTANQALPAFMQDATGTHVAPTFTATASQTLPSHTQDADATFADSQAETTWDFEDAQPLDGGATGSFEVAASAARNGSYGLRRNSTLDASYLQTFDTAVDAALDDTFEFSGWVRTDAGYTTAGLSGLAIGIPTSNYTDGQGYQAIIDVRPDLADFQVRTDFDYVTSTDGTSVGAVAAEEWVYVTLRYEAGSVVAEFRADDAGGSPGTLLDTVSRTDTTYSSGHVGVAAYSLSSFDDLVLAGAGAGTIAQTLPSFTQTAEGTHVPPTYTGTSAQTLPALTQDAAGTHTAPVYTATATQTLAPLGQTATGTATTPTYTATATQTLPPFSQTADGNFVAPTYTATTDQTLPALTQDATGSASAPGTFNATADQTLPALSQDASGTTAVPIYTATAAQDLPALTQDATGTHVAPTYTATTDQTLPSLNQTAEGSVAPPTATGTANQTLPALTQTATGIVVAPTYTGTISQALAAFTQTAAATTVPPGTDGAIAQTLPALTQDAAGTFYIPPVAGTISQTLAALTQQAAGTATRPDSSPTPAERTHVITAEDRTLVVAAEDRTLVVDAEGRTYTVAAEDRTRTIPAEDRTLTVTR